MALILSWETPPEVWQGQYRSATVWRSLPGKPGGANMLVCADAPWGAYLDTETSDVDETYEIHYESPVGSSLSVLDLQIRRWVPPSDTVQVSWSMRRSDSSPWANRTIEISDDYHGGTGEDVRRVSTNLAGKAVSFLTPNTRILVRIDNDPYAYDLVTPDLREITGDALLALATKLPTDRRGWF